MHRTVGAYHVVRPRAVLVPSAGPRPPHSDPIAPAPYGVGMGGSSTPSVSSKTQRRSPQRKEEEGRGSSRTSDGTSESRLLSPSLVISAPFFPREGDPVVFVSPAPHPPELPVFRPRGVPRGYPHCPRRPRLVVKATPPVVGLNRAFVVCEATGTFGRTSVWEILSLSRQATADTSPPTHMVAAARRKRSVPQFPSLRGGGKPCVRPGLPAFSLGVPPPAP
jgi:hypothetical protein